MKSAYKISVALAALATVMSQAAMAAPFTPGNLALYRIGTGDTMIDVHGTPAGFPVFIDEYTTGGTLVQSIPLPTVDPDDAGPQRRLVGQGSATLEGLINRSTDGRYLFLTGYEADVNQTPLAGSLASAVPRVVGRIAADGTIDTSTVIPDLDDGTGTNSGSPRSVISTNGTDLWVTGAEGGVRYTTLGNTAATTQINADITNLRHIDIFNEQMYVSTMSGPTVRIAAVGTGIPTTSGQTLAALPGLPGDGGTSGTNPAPDQFWMADLSPTEPGPDVLYIADDRSQGSNGGLYKYSLVGGTWVASGNLAGVQVPATSILIGLTGRVNENNSVDIFVTRNNGQRLMTVNDASGHNGTLAGAMTELITLPNSPSRWKFAGIDFVPVEGVEAIPGDFNNDTMVDDADFAVFTDEFGETLDGEDFLDWQQNYGTGVTPPVSAVPEPGTAALLAMGLVGLVRRGRRGGAAVA